MAYVYAHIRLDKNEVFYIGIGNTKYRHQAKQNRNDIWNKITSKTEFKVEKLFDNISWAEACLIEKDLISKYGRINIKTGILANMTDGGDGALGLVLTAEARKKIGDASKGRNNNWKGKNHSEESKLKMSLSKIGKPLLKARGKKLSEDHKNAVRNHSKGNKYSLGRIISDESRKKISIGNKGKLAYNKGLPGLKGKDNGMYGRNHTEEARKKMREAQVFRPVAQLSKSGEKIAEYICMSDAARENGFLVTGIQSVCAGRSKSYKGFIWKYL